MLVILVPTMLLWQLDARYYYDWQNHEWFVGYFGEFFRQHGRFPQVINASQVVGLPQPIFYGWLLYPLLGAVSAVTGAAVALRLAIAATFAVQYYAVYAAARRHFRSAPAALIIAAAVTWAVYPLTNLYNRGALTEFFAAAFLTTAMGFSMAAVAEQGFRSARFAWLAGIFALLAAGTHPPTAIVGGIFVALALIATLAVCGRTRRIRRDLLLPAVSVAVLGLVVLAPWIWANFEFRHDLYITAKLRHFAFVPERSDSFVGRFAPFPYDPLAVRFAGAVPTPYAEAQINFSLLLLLIWMVFSIGRIRRSRSRTDLPPTDSRAVAFLILGCAWFITTVAMSVIRPVAEWFSFLAPYVQFPSRFVSHADIGLLLAVLSAGALAAQTGVFNRSRVQTVAIFSLVAGLITLGVTIKLRHAATVREIVFEPRYAWSGDRSTLVTDGRLDAASDYATVRWLKQLMPATIRQARFVSFPVGKSGVDFGKVGTVTVDLPRSGWVVTNAACFTWAHVLVDGREIPNDSRAANDHRAAFWLDGGVHSLRWEWRPASSWQYLRWAAAACGIILVLGAVVLSIADGMSHSERTFRRGLMAGLARPLSPRAEIEQP